MKRKVLNKFDGLKKDNETPWYALVLESTFDKETMTLTKEEWLFVSESIYTVVEKDMMIKVE